MGPTGTNWQGAQAQSRVKPNTNVEKQQQSYDEGARDGQKDGFFASVLKGAGLGSLAGFASQANEAAPGNEDSIIHTQQAD